MEQQQSAFPRANLQRHDYTSKDLELRPQDLLVVPNLSSHAFAEISKMKQLDMGH